MARPLSAGSRRPVWLRRRWLVGHALCATLVLLFVNLGWWQLHRLDERRSQNDLLQRRLGAPAEPLEELLGGADTAALVHRRVRAEGRWDPGSTVLVRSRALEGAQGYHVLSTLLLGTGTGVVVNRGFTPLPRDADEDALRRRLEPDADADVVDGVLRASETRGSIGPRDPDAGRLSVVNRVDLERLGRQSPVALLPVFVQQTGPVRDGEPIRLPLPDLDDEGPHLAYAGQWFLFASIGACGWPLVVRRATRDPEEVAP